VKIRVAVFATLRRYLPDLRLGEAKVIEVAPGCTLAQLRDQLGLPADEVKVVMRNHLQADLDETVQDGDRIVFFPAVAGG
jgi:molybdopterin converting factor small subunit